MRALLKRCSVGAVAAAVLLLAGCSQSTNSPANGESGAAKSPAAPAQLVTAKTAFAPMYKAAIAWSGDVQLMHITPKDVPGFKNEAGKAAMWEATFASPSLHKLRVYTYAITSVLPEIHKGAAAGLPRPWAGHTRDSMPIDLALFSVDSDAAYQAASTDAAAWLAKNPGKALSSLEIGSTYKFQAPVWYVQWGDNKSGYVALVDATSGKVYKNR